MVNTITHGKPLPPEVFRADRGAHRWRAAVRRGVDQVGARIRLVAGRRGPLRTDWCVTALAIPTSLRASLVARLDRLASERSIVQLGACIGREFSHELLARVSGEAPDVLDDALDTLVDAGLISGRGTSPAVVYPFKHALVQDAA